MTVYFIVIIALTFTTVWCNPIIGGEVKPFSTINPYEYVDEALESIATTPNPSTTTDEQPSFNKKSNKIIPSISSIISNITLNITMNNTNINSNLYHHNVTVQDVEDIIDSSGQQYLDQLLIDTNIAHKLDFDEIKKTSEYKLIIGVHIILYRDTINNDNIDKGININDLQTQIQTNSDNKYGKNVIDIKINNDTITTLDPIYTTSTYDDISHTHSHSIIHHYQISFLLLLIILIMVILCIFCIGFLIIICYLKRITNQHKKTNLKISDNDDIQNMEITSAKELNLSIVDDDIDTIDMKEGVEHEILIINNQDIIGEHMSDSEQLYDVYHSIHSNKRNTNDINPGLNDDNINKIDSDEDMYDQGVNENNQTVGK